MYKIIKLLCKFFLVLAGLFAITLLVIVLFINPNDYKPAIIELVKNKANLNLSLPGNLAWSFYPNLGISVEQAELKNLQNTEANLVIFRNATVALSLSDLLASKFEISSIRLTSKLKVPDHASFFLETDLSLALDRRTLNIVNLNLGIDDEHCCDAIKPNWLLRDLSAQVAWQDNKFSILPITVTIYNSKHVADFTLDASSATKVLAFNDRASNFEINDVLTGFGYLDKLQGNSRLEVQLHTNGSNSEAMRHNISGNIILDISNGQIYGVNLASMLGHAETSISSLFTMLKNDITLDVADLVGEKITDFEQHIGASNTPFNRIYTDATINGSLLHNTSVVITHDLYEVSGTGTINLETKAINYNLSVTLRKKIHLDSDQDAVDFMLKIPLPITISGTFNKPVIHLDMGKYALSVLQKFKRESDYITKNVIKSLVDGYLNKNK